MPTPAPELGAVVDIEPIRLRTTAPSVAAALSALVASETRQAIDRLVAELGTSDPRAIELRQLIAKTGARIRISVTAV